VSDNHDMDEVSDGTWWFVYFIVDMAVLLLDVSFLIPVICIEIGCWIMSGGGDD
jgi:hypothetical protein